MTNIKIIPAPVPPLKKSQVEAELEKLKMDGDILESLNEKGEIVLTLSEQGERKWEEHKKLVELGISAN